MRTFRILVVAALLALGTPASAQQDAGATGCVYPPDQCQRPDPAYPPAETLACAAARDASYQSLLAEKLAAECACMASACGLDARTVCAELDQVARAARKSLAQRLASCAAREIMHTAARRRPSHHR
jgi:hypothetical protein